MKLPRVEIFRGKNLGWYFRLRSSNGKIVAQSEGYYSKRNCENGIAALINSIEVRNGINIYEVDRHGKEKYAV